MYRSFGRCLRALRAHALVHLRGSPIPATEDRSSAGDLGRSLRHAYYASRSYFSNQFPELQALFRANSPNLRSHVDHRNTELIFPSRYIQTMPGVENQGLSRTRDLGTCTGDLHSRFSARSISSTCEGRAKVFCFSTIEVDRSDGGATHPRRSIDLVRR